MKGPVIVPSYNHGHFISETLDSVLNQTYKVWECIIINDGSTDKNFEVVKSYKDERIKYIRHEKNMGLPHALNTGFAKATGGYVTWTSDDNYYAKEAIEKMAFFLRDKTCSFVYCDYYAFEGNNPSI